MINTEILRTLQPFSDLKTPTDTIYDHLPYRKDINLVKESDVKLVSGNVVKNMRLVPKESVIIDANPLANHYIRLSKENSALLSDKEYIDGEARETDENTENEPSLSSESMPHEKEEDSENNELSFKDVDEEDDDYSFLSE